MKLRGLFNQAFLLCFSGLIGGILGVWVSHFVNNPDWNNFFWIIVGFVSFVLITGLLLFLNKRPEKNKKVKENFWERNISVVLSLVAIFFSLIAVWYSFHLTEPYLIPRDPILKVWLESNNELSKLSLGSNTSYSYITICFFNEGHGVTGHIHSYSDSDKIVIGDINIPYLTSGNGTCEVTSIRYGDCYKNEPECDYNKLMNSGKKILDLSVSCDFCKKKEFIVPIEICVWENSNLQCENLD